jgi:hypothetical protein
VTSNAWSARWTSTSRRIVERLRRGRGPKPSARSVKAGRSPSFRQGEFKVGPARCQLRAGRSVLRFRHGGTPRPGVRPARPTQAPCMRDAHVTIQPTPDQPSERRPWSMAAGRGRSPAYLPAWLSLAHGDVRGRRSVPVPRAPARAWRRGSRTDVGVAVGEAPRRGTLGRVPAEGWAFRLSRGERVTRTVARVRAIAAMSRSRYSRVPAGGLEGANTAAPRLEEKRLPSREPVAPWSSPALTDT